MLARVQNLTLPILELRKVLKKDNVGKLGFSKISTIKNNQII
ncbi:hypothetical protein EV07_1314 [Prochlorococcus sp. MIT 0603]|nr:hypothetical protein EV07_1314 [Prochlorococcus sp. MIT 0603]